MAGSSNTASGSETVAASAVTVDAVSNSKSASASASTVSSDCQLDAPLAEYFAALRLQHTSNAESDSLNATPLSDFSSIPIRVSQDAQHGRTLHATRSISSGTTLFYERPFLCIPDEIDVQCLLCNGERHQTRSCREWRALTQCFAKSNSQIEHTEALSYRRLTKMLLTVIESTHDRRLKIEAVQLASESGESTGDASIDDIADDDVLRHIAVQSVYPLSRIIGCVLFILLHRQSTLAKASVLPGSHFAAADCLDNGDTWLSALALHKLQLDQLSRAEADTVEYQPRMIAAELLHRQALGSLQSEWTIERLYAVMSILDLNSHTLHNAVNDDNSSALLPFFAMIQHECINENVCFTWLSTRQRMCVRAIRDIAEGEALSINYCRPMLSIQDTRKYTRAHYGFVCQCKRCSGAVEDRLRAFHCLQCAQNRQSTADQTRNGLVYAHGYDEDDQQLDLRCNEPACASSNGAPQTHRRRYLAAEHRALEACGGSIDALVNMDSEDSDAHIDLSALNRLTKIVQKRFESEQRQSSETEPIEAPTDAESADFALLYRSHSIVDAAIDCIINLLINSRIETDQDTDDDNAVSQSALSRADCDECIALQEIRLANMRHVMSSASHWCMAAEYDRLAFILSQCADHNDAVYARKLHQARLDCASVNKQCFGEESDVYQRIMQEIYDEQQQQSQSQSQ